MKNYVAPLLLIDTENIKGNGQSTLSSYCFFSLVKSLIVIDMSMLPNVLLRYWLKSNSQLNLQCSNLNIRVLLLCYNK